MGVEGGLLRTRLGVVAVPESLTFHESWLYNCAHCMTVWQEDYEVRCNDDGHGHESVIYFRDGQRCVTPWVDHSCPTCKSCAVKSRPAPWSTKPVEVPSQRQTSHLDLVFHLRRLHAY
jgi:hypothetical protein